MSIKHKFYQTSFGNGFETHNAILDITPYKPELMIVGTFNPDTPNTNYADFFYGRNFFWTAFKNLFNHNCMVGRITKNMYTPSGAGTTVYRSMIRLLNHWVHNNNQTLVNWTIIGWQIMVLTKIIFKVWD